MRSDQSTKVFVTLFLLAIFGACHRTTPPPPVVAAPPSPPPLPPSISLSADRTTIAAGQTITLTWQSTNATLVTLDNAIGSVALNGSRQVTPQASTGYSATARGPGGTATSAAVRINVNVSQPAAAQQAPRPSAITARTPSLAEQFLLTMQTILFNYDDATIRQSEVPKLQSAARWLKDHAAVRFRIEGNADERGSQEYNIALGDERAAAVRKYFFEEGISENRMITISYGEERPACREETESCWQANRRAQFVLTP